MNQITNSVRMQMKVHFETLGTPTVESLNSLASGMSKSAAARLFYQTCVLVSGDFLRVEQKEPYGDIQISKGTEMLGAPLSSFLSCGIEITGGHVSGGDFI